LADQVNDENDNVKKVDCKVVLAVVGANLPKSDKSLALLGLNRNKVDKYLKKIEDNPNSLTTNHNITAINFLKDDGQRIHNREDDDLNNTENSNGDKNRLIQFDAPIIDETHFDVLLERVVLDGARVYFVAAYDVHEVTDYFLLFLR
jgi:hypothetical protein